MKVLEHLSMEAQMLEMKNEIQNKVRQDLDKQQREYFLQQQMRTIQDELGDNPQEQDVKEFRDRAKDKKWNNDVKKLFTKELEKLYVGRPPPDFREKCKEIEGDCRYNVKLEVD